MKSENSLSSHERIQSLDGLRGIAIMLVICFHVFAWYPNYIPFATHQEIFIFKYGYLGVELFFFISGFVIYLTLDKCNTFVEFIFRRWIRLFPAMFIATILLYTTAFLMPERPGGLPGPLDILPGIFFLDPVFFNKLFNIPAHMIEGSFWSLFIEAKFYVIFGALYFINKNNAIYLFTSLFLILFFYHISYPYPYTRFDYFLDVLGIRYFGWFSIGAFIYQMQKSGKQKFFFFALILLPLAVYATKGADLGAGIFILILYLIFTGAIVNPYVAKIASSKYLVFMGFISYPLYLIHEKAMVDLTLKTHLNFPFLPDILTPFPGIILVLVIAYIIAKYAEPSTRAVIYLLLSKRSKKPLQQTN